MNLIQSQCFSTILEFLPVNKKCRISQLSSKVREKMAKNKWIQYRDLANFLNEKVDQIKKNKSMIYVQSHEISDLEMRVRFIERENEHISRQIMINNSMASCYDCGFEVPREFLIKSNKGIKRCKRCYYDAVLHYYHGFR